MLSDQLAFEHSKQSWRALQLGIFMKLVNENNQMWMSTIICSLAFVHWLNDKKQ